MPLRHTRYGWFDKERAPYVSQDASTRKKTLRLMMLPKEGRCVLPRSVGSLDECPPMTLAECWLLLANVSLGLRTTVLHGQSRYIDRWDKTFFHESSPLKLSLSQDTVYRLSSLANYIHIRRIDKSRGVVEALYEEYLFICGQLSYSLLDASRRYMENEEKELRWEIDSRRNNLYTQDISPIASALSSDMDAKLAMEIVEGAMRSSALRDRTATKKDKENKQLQNILQVYGSPSIEMDDMSQRLELVTQPLVDYLVVLSQSLADEFWLIRPEEDRTTSSKKWASAHPSRRYKEIS